MNSRSDCRRFPLCPSNKYSSATRALTGRKRSVNGNQLLTSLCDVVPPNFVCSLAGSDVKPIATRSAYFTQPSPGAVRAGTGHDLDGEQRDYCRSATDELIEDALRKLATEQMVTEDIPTAITVSRVVFSMYEFREELAKRGHTRSYRVRLALWTSSQAVCIASVIV